MRAEDVDFLAGVSAENSTRMVSREELREERLDALAGKLAKTRGWSRRRARRWLERQEKQGRASIEGEDDGDDR